MSRSSAKENSPVIEVCGEDPDEVRARLELPEERDYAIGAPRGATIATAGHTKADFNVHRGTGHCLLAPVASLSLNGRPVRQHVLLANDDRILVGDTEYRYRCPGGGKFPIFRVADTFWVLRDIPQGWSYSPQTGFFRQIHAEFVENVWFNQDELDGGTLTHYVEKNAQSMQHAVEGFETWRLPARAIYRADACDLQRREFSIQGKVVGQYQYCVQKQHVLGIATWTLPVAKSREQSAPDRLFELLHHAFFA